MMSWFNQMKDGICQARQIAPEKFQAIVDAGPYLGKEAVDAKLVDGIAYRDQHGLFRSRVQLREIEGFGGKTFEQAAGFLRIKDGENPLDRTAVHPESYSIVERMAASLGTSIGELIENPSQINSIDFKTFL